MPQKMKHQYCFLLIIFVIVMLIMYMRFDYGTKNPFIEDVKDSSKTENNKSVFTKMEDIKQPSENIFFLETRCTTNKSAQDFEKSGDGVLTARQGCAIESTARTNPGRNIYVFLSCFPGDGDSPLLQKLTALPSVKLVFLHPRAVLLHTSAQGVEELLEKSIYPVEHSSDLFRLALLWKYGGTYFDLDVINIRSLEPLGTDWVGMQDSATIANGVLNVHSSGPGHELVGRALERVVDTYNPSSWAGNGPGLLTPLILDFCRVDSVEEAVAGCQGFTVLNTSVLYPLNYPSWGVLFDDTRGVALVEELERSAFSIHFWNRMSHDREVRLNSTQAYALLAKKFCPAVSSQVEEFW